MFVPQDLAARIDRAEARLSLAVATAAQTADPALSVHMLAIGGGAAVLLRPGSPMNKLIGLGFTVARPAFLARAFASDFWAGVSLREVFAFAFE